MITDDTDDEAAALELPEESSFDVSDAFDAETDGEACAGGATVGDDDDDAPDADAPHTSWSPYESPKQLEDTVLCAAIEKLSAGHRVPFVHESMPVGGLAVVD